MPFISRPVLYLNTFKYKIDIYMYSINIFIYNTTIKIGRLNMVQHFLLSAKAHNLSLIKIARMNDFQAIASFRQVHWFETKGKPVCPCCGSSGKIYFITSRKQFKCKEYASFFRVIGGTIFHGYKLSLQTILMAISIFVNAAKRISALQLSRDLDIQYKTA